MKVQEMKINNKCVTHIYIGKEESTIKEVKEKIDELKKENRKVVVFSGGSKDTKNTLKQMLQIEKNLLEN